MICSLICLTSCSVRKTILSCNTGKGEDWNYSLKFQVYSDFDRPYLESTKISTSFQNKKEAEKFTQKYGIITNKNDKSDITKNGERYIVNIEKTVHARYGTIDEYNELKEVMNKKGKVCN